MSCTLRIMNMLIRQTKQAVNTDKERHTNTTKHSARTT